MINKIDVYEESLYIRFTKGGDIFKGISKLPEYKIWTKVINHLKKRGFEIKIPKYFTDNKWGHSSHKVAFKGDVVCCLEFEGGQIEIKFGNIQNLWENHEHHFWSLTDQRARQLNYLETKRIELELNKFLDIFSKETINYENAKLSPTERILKDKRESYHSRDISKLDELGLDGVVFQMGEHDFGRNSKDKNEKQINCGDEKYFYDRKTLVKGLVYHSLNNRWWVLSGGELDSVGSYELFDYNGQPRRKQLKTEEKINRLEYELRKHEDNKNYLRCMTINKQIEKLKSTEKIYNVWSLKWNSWWGANNSGYTTDKRLAGIYLESNILGSQDYYNDGKINKAILA